MTSPFPFESWARPGKDAFDFWISFFPTAPLFGVEWRFAEMIGPMADPTMNPFMQAGTLPAQTPFVMPFPGTTLAGAAARPGEFDSPARADEPQGRPVAKATAVTADAAKQATRVAAETGKAAARTAEATVKAGATIAEKRAGDRAAGDRTGETPKKGAEVATGAEAVANAGAKSGAKADAKTGNGAAAAGETDRQAEKKAKARAAVPEKAKTAVETAPAAEKAAKAQPEVVEAVIAAGPRPKGLLSKRPDDADDLKMLKGVGPGLEKQLNDLGLWKLEQLSKMSDADLAWIDANLTSFKGRCFRDDWVGQARSRLKN